MSSSRRSSPKPALNKVQKLLETAFGRKCLAHPGYSKRALARDLGVSSGFITKVFQGTKALPRERLEELGRLLELDIHERLQLFDWVVIGTTKRPAGVSSTAETLLGKRAIHQGPPAGVLSRWYVLAVLQGLSLEEPHNGVEKIQKRLRLTEWQMKEALQLLEKAGEIEWREGQPVKMSDHLYVPAGRSKREVREYHQSLMLKAQEELAKTTAKDYARRLITGFTFTANPDDVENLKTRIVEFLDSLSMEASASAAIDLYQCNVQFFPLTESLPEKGKNKI